MLKNYRKFGKNLIKIGKKKWKIDQNSWKDVAKNVEVDLNH